MQRVKLRPQLDTKDITMIIDGRYLCYRTKYSRGGNLSYNNMDTGVFYGFFNTLQSIANNHFITNTVIMWDVSKSGVRREEFKGYKNRDTVLATPQEVEEKIRFEEINIERNHPFKKQTEQLIEEGIGLHGDRPIPKIEKPVKRMELKSKPSRMALTCKE